SHRVVFVFEINDENRPEKVRRIELPKDFRTAIMERFAEGRTKLKAEGIAVNKPENKVLIGIREVYDEGNYDTAKMTILVVRYALDLTNYKITGPPEFFDFTPPRDSQAPIGLSDIQRDPADGSYLILASLEAPPPHDVTSHAGVLYRVPGWVLDGPPCNGSFHLRPPIRSFIAKPEGIAPLYDAKTATSD